MNDVNYLYKFYMKSNSAYSRMAFRVLSFSRISLNSIMVFSLLLPSSLIHSLYSARTSFARQLTSLIDLFYGRLLACISTICESATRSSSRSSLLSLMICLSVAISGNSSVASSTPRWCSIKLQLTLF